MLDLYTVGETPISPRGMIECDEMALISHMVEDLLERRLTSSFFHHKQEASSDLPSIKRKDSDLLIGELLELMEKVKHIRENNILLMVSKTRESYLSEHLDK